MRMGVIIIASITTHTVHIYISIGVILRVQVDENWMEVVHEPRFKVIFLGDSSVGKTSLAHLHQTGQVQPNPKATIGFDCYTKNLQTKAGAFVQVSASLPRR